MSEKFITPITFINANIKTPAERINLETPAKFDPTKVIDLPLRREK